MGERPVNHVHQSLGRTVRDITARADHHPSSRAEAFTLKVPANLDAARAAPLLCAGITTYSPLRRWGAGKGRKVGIVGLGGLGHMGVKFAHAMGAHTVLFTTPESKIADGRRLGADEVVISKNADAVARHAGSFDMILDTVSADQDLNAYLALLNLDASLVLVGVPLNPQPVNVFGLLMPRRNLSGSLIGGIAETQEMLDFCGRNGVVCDVEMIRMQQINKAYERMLRSDVKYRFVIDMASLKGGAATADVQPTTSGRVSKPSVSTRGPLGVMSTSCS